MKVKIIIIIRMEKDVLCLYVPTLCLRKWDVAILTSVKADRERITTSGKEATL